MWAAGIVTMPPRRCSESKRFPTLGFGESGVITKRESVTPLIGKADALRILRGTFARFAFAMASDFVGYLTGFAADAGAMVRAEALASLVSTARSY